MKEAGSLATCTRECSMGCRARVRRIGYAEDNGEHIAFVAHDTPATEGFFGAWYQTIATAKTRADLVEKIRDI